MMSKSVRRVTARVGLSIALAAVAAALVPGVLSAQEGGASEAAGRGAPDRGAEAWDAWRAGVDEQARDLVSGETMVVVAYGAVWAILFLYVLRLAADLRALGRETDDLRRMLKERQDEAGRP